MDLVWNEKLEWRAYQMVKIFDGYVDAFDKEHPTV